MSAGTAQVVSECAARLRSAGILRGVQDSGADTSKRREIEVRNPGTGISIGSIPSLDCGSAKRVVLAARHGFKQWQALESQERSRLMQVWFDLVVTHREELACLVTLEEGKPIDEARNEIDYAASFIEWYAREATSAYEHTGPSHIRGARMTVRRVPVGVVLAITPWNFPSAMVTRKAAAALAAGCSVIVRPAEETPFSAIALSALAEEAGMPRDVLSIITGTPSEVIDPLCEDTDIDALSFTGSTRVGRHLLASAASTVKRCIMELGGNAPFIVFADANLDRAVAAAVDAKFVTSGQDCLAANRILVQREIYAPFVERFTTLARELRVGHGLLKGTQIGPLIHERAVTKCQDLVDDAVAQGARLLIGGHRHEAGPDFFEATVVSDVTPTMRLFQEEIFGPVAAITPFDASASAVELANDTEYGLMSYIFTSNASRAREVAKSLHFGMVAINRVTVTGPPVPFGGMKQSGLGREGSRAGLEAFTEIQYVCESDENSKEEP